MPQIILCARVQSEVKKKKKSVKCRRNVEYFTSHKPNNCLAKKKSIAYLSYIDKFDREYSDRVAALELE